MFGTPRPYVELLANQQGALSSGPDVLSAEWFEIAELHQSGI